jgi:septum formation protein
VTAAPASADIVLASTSPYRRELLARIVPQFRAIAPGVDETRLPGETAAKLAARLAAAKALAVADRCPGAVVIGSDQAAELDGAILGKPGDAAAARAQLAAASGRGVTFHTAVCIVDARTQERHAESDVTRVQFRALDAATIARYVERDRPLDCAGAFRVEALGIALFERIESDDPTALVGLPLIALARLLRRCAIDII